MPELRSVCQRQQITGSYAQCKFSKVTKSAIQSRGKASPDKSNRPLITEIHAPYHLFPTNNGVNKEFTCIIINLE